MCFPPYSDDLLSDSSKRMPVGRHKMAMYMLLGWYVICELGDFPGGSSVKNLPAMQETMGSIPGLGRSPGGGLSNLLQISCLANPTDRGAWQAMIHWVEKSQTQLEQLSTHTCDLESFIC